MTSAGLADLTDRQAEAVSMLDRALEARLGELDRAFAIRRAQLEGRLAEAQETVAEMVEQGLAEFKQAASGERRALHEEAAAELSALGELLKRIRELERAAGDRIEALERLIARSGPS